MAKHNKCDHGGCQTDATVTLTAVYSFDRKPAHPLWASYPAAMYQACNSHVATLARMDAQMPGSTTAWLMRPK